MIDLKNIAEIKNLDPKDVYGSTGMLAAQCEQIWADAKKLSVPADYKQVKNIVINGMGGSAYGAHVALSLLKDKLSLPLVLTDDYYLPGFMNKDTLVIPTSYSGTTEESLSGAKEAVEKGAKVIALTSGGKLAKFVKENGHPVLQFDPKFNPSGQPRLGTGYIVLGTIALLNQMGLVSIDEKEVKTAINELKENQEKVMESARNIATLLKDTIPVIFAAEFLKGNAHIMRNQFNETAKSFSAFSELPELNHHLMEGLKNPADKKLQVLIIDSDKYLPVLKKRIALTKDVVEKNSIKTITYPVGGSNELSQMLNVLSFGGYVTFYLAILYKLDPSLIPWVDYFKEQLKK